MNTKTIETNELTLVVKQSGIEKSKGEIISNTLGAFFEKAKEWNDTINTLQINDISETGKMKMAREGRLSLKNMRLDAKKIVEEKRNEVKAKMADYVLEDKLWLKSFQMVEATFKNLEIKLEEKEKFAERKENERLAKLERERINELMPFNEFCSIESIDLKNISDEDFKGHLDKAKKLFDLDKKERERIEKERIEKEKREAEAREKQRLENIRLKKEAKKREAKIIKERAEAEAKQKRLEEIARKEKEKAELEKRKLEAENLAKLKKEQDEKLRLQNELKAKEETELKAKKEADEKLRLQKIEAEKLAKAPIKKQLNKWVQSFNISETNIKNKTSNEIIEKFEAFKKWAVMQVENL